MDIDINPKLDALRHLGLSRAEFNRALNVALDRLADKPIRELPTPPEIPLLLHGREHRLGDLARIDVRLAPGQQVATL
jgi:hypothetical protein